MKKLLLIDDDPELVKLLRIKFDHQSQEYQILHALNGDQGISLAYNEHPDMIILDIMMPGKNGFEVCERLREMTDTPILMLSAVNDPQSIGKARCSGADDYLGKPFEFNELEKRVHTLLGVQTAQLSDAEDFGNQIEGRANGWLEVDLQQEIVRCGGNRIQLTPTEFQVLRYLALHEGRIVKHNELISEIWGKDNYWARINGKRNLCLYIHNLREKIEPDPAKPRYITTKWGKGYIFFRRDEIKKTTAS